MSFIFLSPDFLFFLFNFSLLLLGVTCPFTDCAGESSSNEEEEPAQKKKRDQLLYIQSEEFQKILNAKSRHGVVLQAVWQVALNHTHQLRFIKTCFSFWFSAVTHRFKVDVISSLFSANPAVFLHLKVLSIWISSQAEYQLQERYFDALVKKEQMEEKMKGIREMKCRAVTCKKVLS